MTFEAITPAGEVVPLTEAPVPRVRLLATGVELPSDLSEPDWRRMGEWLGHVEQNISWWLGDWWAFGEARYGERKAIVTAPEWEGPAYQTCVNAANIAQKFETNRRRLGLTFSHHAEVAALDADEADALLDWCQQTDSGKPRSTRELRGEVHRRRVSVGLIPSSSTRTIADLHALAGTGQRFGCIYADPPWHYDNQGTRAATENHYDGMSVNELCELPIRDMAADDAHLHLWTTNAFIFDAPQIFGAWGFEFRSSLVWVKPQMGIGNYWRNSHEFLLTAIRGNAKRFNDKSLKSWLECDRGPHSAKPEQVRAMIERASPGPYLELFGRLPAERWTVWGNQIELNLFMSQGAA